MPEPLHRWVPVPKSGESDGDLAAELGESVGMVMDNDQVDILNAIFAEDEPEVPTAFEAAVVAPRQNIKTSTLEIAALADVFTFGQPLHVWTAHLYSTTQKSFEHMVALVGSNEDLRRRCVWPPRAAHGEQAIELLTGEKIEFRARSRGGGRGFAGVARITFDEALFLSSLAMGALLPTLATVRGAQVRYGASAGFEDSDALRSLRDRGRKGGDPRLAYFEWGAPRVPCLRKGCLHIQPGLPGHQPGCALDREDLWYRANPALGRRIHIDLMRSFRRSLPPEEFSREFLTWWEDPPEDGIVHAIDFAAWKARRDAKSCALDPVVVGLDVSPGRVQVANLSVAGWREDGRMHGELVMSAPGTAWVLPALIGPGGLIERVDPAALVLDGRGPAGSLLPEIRAAGLDPRVLTSGERSQADEGLVAAIENDQLRLPRLPMPALDAAAEAATWRESGDVRYFDRRAGGAAPSPLVALSLARFGLLEVAAVPPRRPGPPPEAIPDAAPTSAGRELDLLHIGF
ncbi:MAG: hypothetical protein HOQ45_20350 [Nocardioidaceae bacterium]|nr:hypothetical protein [Nocardioidaceae bacterium]